jgi:Ser/Thr protein kinase RdoA (MazF antagonist)
MAANSLDLIAQTVLKQYPISAHDLMPLGNRGGFSGAALWRVKQFGGDWCLRVWPGDISGSRLADIHRLMKLAREQGLNQVPAILETRSGATWAEEADRSWEVATWMPGGAATPAQVNRKQVQAACTALARLHNSWAYEAVDSGLFPAIQRRLTAFRQWQERIQAGWQLDTLHTSDSLEVCSRRAWQLLHIHADKIPGKLRPWQARRMPLQLCLCDIWHDHVLFQGDEVTGLVDFGGIKIDHVAVDLARLLGSLVEDRVDLRAAGLEAYARLRPLSLQEQELVSVLDETGTLVGLMTWLQWLYVDGKRFDDREAAARRLQALVERVDSW